MLMMCGYSNQLQRSSEGLQFILIIIDVDIMYTFIQRRIAKYWHIEF